jgi:aspartate/glutamate racemase
MIGILGGLGPQAAGEFYSRLVHAFCKKGVTPNPHIVLNTIPDPGIDCLKNNENLHPHLAGIDFLVRNKAEYVVMACNTIHIHLEKLRKESGFDNILSIKDAVIKKMKPILATGNPICFLSTSLTHEFGLYDFSDEFSEANTIQLTSWEQLQLDHVIEQYKKTSSESCYDKMQTIVNRITERVQGPICFIPACTEISILLNQSAVHKIDTMDALIDHTVDNYLLTHQHA